VPLYVLARHAHSELNLARRINGDPSVPVGLTAQGREEAARLGRQLANVPIELIVHTRFARTRETAHIARETCIAVPTAEEPLLDDVDVGELEGQTIDEYRAWKDAHTRADRFPGGESLDESALRYAAGFRALLARPERTILVVCHEIPLRYALNAARGSDDLDGPVHAIPNAAPFLFDEDALARAADRIAALVECG
jgi:2,3-bisphosphoglycerate-dependent phosphoglycerate mutase